MMPSVLTVSRTPAAHSRLTTALDGRYRTDHVSLSCSLSTLAAADVVVVVGSPDTAARVAARLDEAHLDRQLAVVNDSEDARHPEESQSWADAWLTWPPTVTELLDTVERLTTRVAYDRTLGEYFSVATRVATLETEHSSETLEASHEYSRLRERLRRLRTRLARYLDELGTDGFTVAIGS